MRAGLRGVRCRCWWVRGLAMSRNDLDLRGRTALVTGSSRGIGQAIAALFAQYGATVGIHAASADEAAQAGRALEQACGRPVACFGFDLSEAGAGHDLAKAALARLGAVDIVVVNASVQLRQPFLQVTPDAFARQVAVNLAATFELLQDLLPGMAERKWGRVLTIGSVQQVKPNPNLAAYAALKSAQANLAANLARQYASSGVTVNNLAPGLIDTDRNADLKEDSQAYASILSRIPGGRAGTPTECAWPALLLCSEAGSYITGIDLMVDGGLHLP